MKLYPNTFSLHFLDTTEFLLEYKIIAIYIDIAIPHQCCSHVKIFKNLPQSDKKNCITLLITQGEVSPSTRKVGVLCYLNTQYASNKHTTSPFVIELSFHQTRKTIVFPHIFAHDAFFIATPFENERHLFLSPSPNFSSRASSFLSTHSNFV